MDKFFLLTYTSVKFDGIRREKHAWFCGEEALRRFVENEKRKDIDFEVDLAIEILSYRFIQDVSV